MGRRADVKRLRRQISIDDHVTWGFRRVPERVVEVEPSGVWVDVTAREGSRSWGSRRTIVRVVDTRVHLFVKFIGNNRSRHGDVQKVEMK